MEDVMPGNYIVPESYTIPSPRPIEKKNIMEYALLPFVTSWLQKKQKESEGMMNVLPYLAQFGMVKPTTRGAPGATEIAGQPWQLQERGYMPEWITSGWQTPYGTRTSEEWEEAQKIKMAQNMWNLLPQLIPGFGGEAGGGMTIPTGKEDEVLIQRWMNANPKASRETIVAHLKKIRKIK